MHVELWTFEHLPFSSAICSSPLFMRIRCSIISSEFDACWIMRMESASTCGHLCISGCHFAFCYSIASSFQPYLTDSPAVNVGNQMKILIVVHCSVLSAEFPARCLCTVEHLSTVIASGASQSFVLPYRSKWKKQRNKLSSQSRYPKYFSKMLPSHGGSMLMH